jgi:hypothetical protein
MGHHRPETAAALCASANFRVIRICPVLPNSEPGLAGRTCLTIAREAEAGWPNA